MPGLTGLLEGPKTYWVTRTRAKGGSDTAVMQIASLWLWQTVAAGRGVTLEPRVKGVIGTCRGSVTFCNSAPPCHDRRRASGAEIAARRGLRAGHTPTLMKQIWGETGTNNREEGVL